MDEKTMMRLSADVAVRVEPGTGERPALAGTLLRDGYYAVRPERELGTCGWYPCPWRVVYVKARTEAEAIRKAGERCFDGKPKPMQFARVDRGDRAA